jgi:hypothetical protein
MKADKGGCEEGVIFGLSRPEIFVPMSLQINT